MLIIEKSRGRSAEHYKTRDLILNFLGKNNLNYKIFYDYDVGRIDYSKFDTVLSLGGDGTFLNATKYVKGQNVFGVNSNPKGSVGFLLNFDASNIAQGLENYLNGKFDTKVLARLGARVDSKNLECLALNDIFVGDRDITTTSHLDVSACGKSGYVRGNGIIVATKQGSNAFYKSAGGTSFDVDALGYVLVLPYKIEGDIEKSKLCSNESLFEITAKRSGYSISFDCDKKRTFALKEGSRVEIISSLKDGLSVVKNRDRKK